MESLTRVLHLRASAFVGGPERQILAQVREIDPERFHVTIATFLRPDEGRALLEEAHRRGVRAIGLPAGGPLDLRPVGDLSEVMRCLAVDLVCAHDAKSTFVGYFAARRCRIPSVAWARGWTGETLRVRLYDAVHRRMLRRVDAVVAVSHAMRERLIGLGIRPDRIEVIPNAFAGSPVAACDGRLRRTLGIGPDVPLIVSVGRLSREKGHRYLIEAAGQLKQAGYRFALVIAGDGRERARLERRIRGLGIADSVHLLGFRRDIAEIMAEADVVVLPSLTEGLPNVVLEAFAAGKPVVATAVGGVPELVRHGRTGILVRPADSAALAEGIAACLDDCKTAARLGAEGRQLLAEYGLPSLTRRAEALYARLVGRSAQTGL